MNKDLAISIDSLRKEYKLKDYSKVKVAIKNISLDLFKGEFFGLLGKNGAGKSTLINIISGSCLKTSGTVRISGYNIDYNRHDATRCLGVVNQEEGFLNFIKVRESLINHMGYYGVKPNIKKVNEVLKIVSLLGNADQPLRSLSGGMKKRLMIAKALINDPKIIILDEPTAGVDIENRNSLWKYITKINKELGISILLTTHYMEEAERYCNRIAIMSNGKIAKIGTKEEILSCDTKFLIFEIANKTQSQQYAFIESLKEKNLKIDVEFIDECSIKIKFKKSDLNLKSILYLLSSSEIEISDIRVQEQTLEDVFLSVQGD